MQASSQTSFQTSVSCSSVLVLEHVVVVAVVVALCWKLSPCVGSCKRTWKWTCSSQRGANSSVVLGVFRPHDVISSFEASLWNHNPHYVHIRVILRTVLMR